MLRDKIIKWQKELSIRFNKNYKFLQILLINIVKFICGCGFDLLSFTQVLIHTSETEDALQLTQHHLLNHDGYVVKSDLVLKARTLFFFIKAAESFWHNILCWCLIHWPQSFHVVLKKYLMCPLQICTCFFQGWNPFHEAFRLSWNTNCPSKPNQYNSCRVCGCLKHCSH